MKKRSKLISLGILTTTVFYSCSPVMTLAVTEEQSSTVQSSNSLIENNFSIDQSSSTIIESETSSSKEVTTGSTELENEYVTADISSFINKQINLVPVSNSELRFSESENGLAIIDNKNNLTNQTFSFQATEDGWLTIQNNSTKNYLTIEENSKSLFFANLQESDNQKWHFVNEENGTYYIESKTKQLLTITEDNNLQVSNGESEQRWSLEEALIQADSSIESSTSESTTETTNESTTNFQEPKATSEAVNVVEQSPIDKTKMKITIKNPNGGNVSNVQFPTWSNTNGQDDIKWLNGTKNSDGSWSVVIDANQYNHDGQFNTHIYTKVNGKDTYLASTSYNLEFSPANIVTQTAIGKNKMKITIANPNRGNVSNVQFPTWSNTNGQDDIKWLNGTKNNDGSWSVVIDANQYKQDGQFNTHIYTKVNGKDTFLNSTSYNLEFTNVNNIEKTAIGKNKMKITITNPNRGNVSNVQFPTWSNTNGQDDIKWLNGTKNNDGSWSVVIDANQYKHDGQFNTHIYTKVNGKDTFLNSTSYNLEKTQDDTAIRLSKKPYYYSQLDGRWSNIRYGMSTLGPSGCVPTSMAMVLRGHFGINVSPVDTANRIYGYGGFNQRYFGASGTDFVRGMNSYGKTVVTINSLAQLNDYLSKGYPVVMFVNVGIGHAVVAHGYSSGGYTTVYDPYGKQFYNGTVATGTLWSTPSTDSIDWSAGRPYFAIK